MNGHAKATNGSMSATSSPNSDSSPVIDVTAAGEDDSSDLVAEIRLDGEESLEDRITTLLYNFPYAENGAFSEAAELIADQQNKGG
jgi:hypothetical protein